MQNVAPQFPSPESSSRRALRRAHRRALSSVAILGVLISAGCASAGQQGALPFHAALLPVRVIVESAPVIEASAASRSSTASNALFQSRTREALEAQAGSDTELTLDLQADGLVPAVEQALRSAFSEVTAPTPEQGLTLAKVVRESRERGADLAVDVECRYTPSIRTSVDGLMFGLNLPLFAIGGPFCWFVPDRDYFVDVRVNLSVYDMGSAFLGPKSLVPDRQQALLSVERTITKIPLSLLGRTGNVGSYFLSLLVPAGFLSSEGDAVSESLAAAIAESLGSTVVDVMGDRREEILRSQFVAFQLDNVRIATGDGSRFIEGDIELSTEWVAELGPLRYRDAAGKFQPANWTGHETIGKDRERYSFQVPLAPGAQTAQIEVEQLDRLMSKRTFTLRVK